MCEMGMAWYLLYNQHAESRYVTVQGDRDETDVTVNYGSYGRFYGR